MYCSSSKVHDNEVNIDSFGKEYAIKNTCGQKNGGSVDCNKGLGNYSLRSPKTATSRCQIGCVQASSKQSTDFLVYAPSKDTPRIHPGHINSIYFPLFKFYISKL